jgi:hypothetical protein
VLRRGGAYPDSIRDARRYLAYVERGDVVERILIHLDRQSAPSDFKVYGRLVVPFYNYLQAAFVLYEDGRIPALGVLRVAADLTVAHNFDPTALARSYADLARRGHVTGRGIGELETTFSEELQRKRLTAASELTTMMEGLVAIRRDVRASELPPEDAGIDYLGVVATHNPRRAKRR